MNNGNYFFPYGKQVAKFHKTLGVIIVWQCDNSGQAAAYADSFNKVVGVKLPKVVINIPKK